MTKRFYKQATAVPFQDQFCIHLDDKSLKSPKGNIFIVPNQLLADYVTNEWNNVTDIIIPKKMPITQICMTALDFHDEKESDWMRDILAYIDSDALCFWTGEVKPIWERQQQLIKPVIVSLEQYLALPIIITDKLEMIHQNERWYNFFDQFLNGLSPIQFTNFYLTTIECGSIFLALALYHNLITPDQIFDILYLEEIYKSEIYKENIYSIAPDIEQKQETSKKFLTAAQIVFQSL